jgi:hypothetical protein
VPEENESGATHILNDSLPFHTTQITWHEKQQQQQQAQPYRCTMHVEGVTLLFPLWRLYVAEWQIAYESWTTSKEEAIVYNLIFVGCILLRNVHVRIFQTYTRNRNWELYWCYYIS